MCSRILAAAAVTLLMCSAASGTTIRALSPADRVREAATVVRGTVLARTAVWSDDKSRIYTDSVVWVDEVIAGQPAGPTITVRQIGGTIGDISMLVPGVARIRRGEEVVLFLRTDGTRYYLVGMAQGKYGIRTHHGRKVVSQDTSGLTLLRVRRAGPVGPPPGRGPLTLDALRRSTQSLARSLGRRAP